MRWTWPAIEPVTQASPTDASEAEWRRFAMASTAGTQDHVYKILDLVGSSDRSIEDAIQNAIARASKTIREMKWFEVVQTRGHIEGGKVAHYQVTLRVGFTLEA
jgi:flavin-binding protein dodecin